MNSALTIGRRHQVEEWLDRELTEEELKDAPSLDRLSPVQLAVVALLASRNRLACLLYLQGIVEDLPMTEALPFIDRIRDELPYGP